VDCRIWWTIQEHVYHTDIHSVDELKQRLIQVWCGLDWDIIDTLLTSGVKDFQHAFVRKMLISNAPCQLAHCDCILLFCVTVLLKILRTFLYKYTRNTAIYRTILAGGAEMQISEVTDFIPYVRLSYLAVTVKTC